MNEFEDFNTVMEKHLGDLKSGGDGFDEELNMKASILQAAVHSLSMRVTEKETIDEDRCRNEK